MTEDASVTETYAVGDSETSHHKTVTTFDEFGQPLSTQTRVFVDGSDEFTVGQVVSEYDNDPENWKFTLTRVTTTASTRNPIPSLPGSYNYESRSTTDAYTYFPNGALQTVTRFEGTDQQLTTEFHYTDQGLADTTTSYPSVHVVSNGQETNVSRASLHMVTEPARTTNIAYDEEEAQFPVKVTNALGHSAYALPDRLTGAVAGSIDPNGLATWRFFDGFGRLKGVEDLSGHVTYRYVPSGGNAKWAVEESHLTGERFATEYDRRSRPVRAVSGNHLDGSREVREMRMTYDWAGRLASRSTWALEGVPVAQTTWKRDQLGRPFEITNEDGYTTSISSRLFSTTVIDPEGHKRKRVRNFLGDVVSSSEFKTATTEVKTSFTYGPFHLLEEVLDTPSDLDPEVAGKSRTIRFEYDDALNMKKRTLVMPNGQERSWTMEYSPFGELAATSDPEAVYYGYTRDRLGRVKQVDSSFGTETREWDTAPHGIGKVRTSLSVDGIRLTYGYDNRGLLSTARETVGQEVFDLAFDYDSFGRPSQVTYPFAGPTVDPRMAQRDVYDQDGNFVGRESYGLVEPFFVTYAYDVDGRLKSATGSVTGKLWEVTSYDEANRIREEQFGDAWKRTQTYKNSGALYTQLVQPLAGGSAIQNLTYEYDHDGNVQQRIDALGATETFGYDYSDRLWSWTVNQPGKPEVTEEYVYDELGNLKKRSSTLEPGQPWIYKHASESDGLDVLSSIQHGTNDPPAVLAFDKAGRQKVGPRAEVATWGQWNKLKTLVDGQGTHARSFTADGDLALEASTDSTSMLVFGRLYRRVTDSTGTRHFFNVSVAGSGIVQVEYRKAPSETRYLWGARYTFADRIGSPDVVVDGVERKVDPSGGISWGRYSPFGDRRAAEFVGESHLGPPLPVSEPLGGTSFGGHEASTLASLVDMNGRVYDPLQGRFLSRDPVVRDVLDGQAWHPYAYCGSNPVTLVDPSGYTDTPPQGTGKDPFSAEPLGGIETPDLSKYKLNRNEGSGNANRTVSDGTSGAGATDSKVDGGQEGAPGPGSRDAPLPEDATWADDAVHFGEDTDRPSGADYAAWRTAKPQDRRAFGQALAKAKAQVESLSKAQRDAIVSVGRSFVADDGGHGCWNPTVFVDPELRSFIYDLRSQLDELLFYWIDDKRPAGMSEAKTNPLTGGKCLLFPGPPFKVALNLSVLGAGADRIGAMANAIIHEALHSTLQYGHSESRMNDPLYPIADIISPSH